MTTILSTWNEPGKVAIDAAWAARAAGADLVSTLEEGLAKAERDPHLTFIGLGSSPNRDGELELDASIMVGEDLRCGAVCAVRGIVPVISVARLVMERTPHVMLAGDNARRFAIEQGFRPTNLMTPTACDLYAQYDSDPRRERGFIHTASDKPSDTVTMLAHGDNGRFVAASSTSGMPYKVPGRVGDSPIIGAGIYADDEAGAAGATGHGEELWRACASFRAVEAMRRGLTAQEACDETIRAMMKRRKAAGETPSVVFAVDRQGGVGAAVTSRQFEMWVCRDGQMECLTFGPIGP